MPLRMLINTASTVGYNNQPKQATPDIKPRVNNSINESTKKAAVRLIDGKVSKVNSPNSHPSNLIHKEVVKAQGLGEPSKQKAPAP